MQRGRESKSRFVKNSLQGGDASGHKMPAAMNGNAVDPMSAVKDAPVFRFFLPLGIVRECRDHLDIVTGFTQKFADRHVVRRDAGNLRRIINSPNNDAHEWSAQLLDASPRRRSSYVFAMERNS